MRFPRHHRAPVAHFWTLAWLLCLAVCAGPSAVAAPPTTPGRPIAVPEMRSLVTDTTDTLTPTQQTALREKLDDFHARVGPQLAVLVVPTTGGEAIEAYAARTFAKWQLGNAKDNDGLLILVALKDRRMRIEVGQGLEGRVPDLVASRITDEQMTPRFRQSDYRGGIDAAVDALVERLGGRTRLGGGEIRDELPVVPPERRADDSPRASDITPIGWGVLALFAALFGFGSYRWRAMRFVTAGLVVLCGGIWSVARFVGGYSGFHSILVVIGVCVGLAFSALILGTIGFGMRAAYRKTRKGFALQWLIVAGITACVAYATEGNGLAIAVAAALSMLFVFAASLGKGKAGSSADDDDESSSSGSWSNSSSGSDSDSSSSSSSSSGGGGGSSSGGGASGSW